MKRIFKREKYSCVFRSTWKDLLPGLQGKKRESMKGFSLKQDVKEPKITWHLGRRIIKGNQLFISSFELYVDEHE